MIEIAIGPQKQRDEAERRIEDQQRRHHADQRQRAGHEHHEQPREALQLDHQQRQHHCEHGREHREQRVVGFVALFDGAAFLDAVARGQAVDDGLQRRPDPCRSVRPLYAIDDVAAHRECHVSVAPPQHGLFEGRFHAGQLRQRHGHAAAREHLQVAQASEAFALVGCRSHDDVHELLAAADLRHGSAVQSGLHQALDVGAGQAQEPCLVLVDVDLHRADLLVPV